MSVAAQLIVGFMLFALADGAVTRMPSILSATAPGSVFGRVRDSANQPMPAVSVTAIPERGGGVITAITDREGGYRLEKMADAVYRLDFELAGFTTIRRNHVRVRQDEAMVDVDAVLSVAPVCECVKEVDLPTLPRPLNGQVVDEESRPLPRARVQIATQFHRRTTYTDREGRFLVSAPVEGTWSITASDSGFAATTRKISKATAGPIVLTLRFAGTGNVPNLERLTPDCCPSDYLQSGKR
jgi:hypothetical protein